MQPQTSQLDQSDAADAMKKPQPNIDRLVGAIEQLSECQVRILAVVQRALKIEEPAAEPSESALAHMLPSDRDYDEEAITKYRGAQDYDKNLLALRHWFGAQFTHRAVEKVGAYYVRSPSRIVSHIGRNMEPEFAVYDHNHVQLTSQGITMTTTHSPLINAIERGRPGSPSEMMQLRRSSLGIPFNDLVDNLTMDLDQESGEIQLPYQLQSRRTI
jgi:hypothetical protein